MEEVQKSVRHTEKYKGVNLRLKSDIIRLRELLSETEKYKVFANSIEQKHYLGKPSKEHECWFSQGLVADTENFLKKFQMHGNKDLLVNLVRFVSRHIE